MHNSECLSVLWTCLTLNLHYDVDDLNNAWRRRSAFWTCSLSIILTGRQESECGKVAGKKTTAIKRKAEWNLNIWSASVKEEEEEAPRHPRHLNVDGVGPRGRVRVAAGRPQQIIGRFHYFSIMHIAFAAGWGHHWLRTQLGSRTLLRLAAIRTIMLIFIFYLAFGGTRLWVSFRLSESQMSMRVEVLVAFQGVKYCSISCMQQQRIFV